jgi:surfactin synthase thioesterase subunit
VFALQAIGHFRLVGLFKRVRVRVKGTPFARADSAVFTPLCLALSAGCALVALSSPGRRRGGGRPRWLRAGAARRGPANARPR